ncbi:right-handed parallel beta-helix repeat-containing protein [Chloroflexota bacterium]
MRHLRSSILAVCTLILGLILSSPPTAQAQTSITGCPNQTDIDTNTVVIFNLNGNCTLPNALSINNNTTINGFNLHTITATGQRHFTVSMGSELALNAVTLPGGNGGATGGAIYNNGKLTVTNSTFASNSATNAGGAIFNEVDGTVTVTGSTFTGNTSDAGGAITNTNELTVIDSSFTGNGGGNFGGAIHNTDSLAVTNSTFVSNSAIAGSAIYNDDGLLTVNGDSRFEANIATSGTIYTYGAIPVTITGPTFFANKAQIGGAIYNGSPLTVTNCTFEENIAPIGSAIYSENTLAVTGSRIIENTGGAIVANSGAVTVTNTTISGNDWHGIYNAGNGAVTVQASSAIIGNGNSGITNTGTGAVTVQASSTITGNIGSGIATASSGNVTITGGSSVHNNTSDGISASSGDVTVTNSTIRNNGDDGLRADSGAVTVTGSTIHDNNNDGLRADSGAVTVTGSTIRDNGNYGIRTDSGVVTVTNSTIRNNTNFGVRTSNPATVVTGNCITGNGTGAFDNGGGAAMDFTNNWWGAMDGPGAPDGPGSGDPVDGPNINFTPWATEPIGPCALPPAPPAAEEEASGPEWSDQFLCDSITFVGGWGIFSEGTPKQTSFTVPEPPPGYAYANQPAHTGWCDVFIINNDHSPLPVTVCWPGSASIVGLHYDLPDLSRAWAVIPTTQQGTNVCASLPRFGGVALLSGGAPAGTMIESPETPANITGTPVTCEVTTTNRINFRDAPGNGMLLGAELSRIPFETTLAATAESNGWLQVEWLGQQGWISADYVAAVCQ